MKQGKGGKRRKYGMGLFCVEAVHVQYTSMTLTLAPEPDWPPRLLQWSTSWQTKTLDRQ